MPIHTRYSGVMFRIFLYVFSCFPPHFHPDCLRFVQNLIGQHSIFLIRGFSSIRQNKCVRLYLRLYSISCTYLVIVAQVAGLAHTHRVQQPVLVLAVVGVLIAAVLPVARRAHVLGVVLSVDVRALGDFHYLLLLVLHDDV
jgi:hypothetical protein